TGASDRKVGSDFSYLEPSAAQWAVDRGLKCVGIDSPSVEKYGSPEGLAHKKLLSHNIGIIENLNSNLKEFAGRRMFLVCLPLLLEGVDAAPARAVLFDMAQ
ncbi:MAG: cyclase family protein, partial [Nitrososphaera sp.]